MARIKKELYDKLFEQAIEFCIRNNYPNYYFKYVETSSNFKIFDIFENETNNFVIRLKLEIVSELKLAKFDDVYDEHFRQNPPVLNQMYPVGDLYVLYIDEEFKKCNIEKGKVIVESVKKSKPKPPLSMI